jgi:hypothetical protein
VLEYEFNFGILNIKGMLKPSSITAKTKNKESTNSLPPVALAAGKQQEIKAKMTMNQIEHLRIDLPSLNGSALSVSNTLSFS